MPICVTSCCRCVRRERRPRARPNSRIWFRAIALSARRCQGETPFHRPTLYPRGRLMTETRGALDELFRLEEATIGELHQALLAGETTCLAVVRRYLDRVRAYNGVASMLVTKDGAEISEAYGTVRALAPIRFPTKTVKASSLLPDLDKYKGPPLEYGRMEPTASDASVQQQFGMIVGIPNAGQVNALATLNIRGERSATCRGVFDLHPSKGPLPK